MKIIIIDDGELFEGTRDQFKDCFFSNASDKNIKEWCKKNGYKLEIKQISRSQKKEIYK